MKKISKTIAKLKKIKNLNDKFNDEDLFIQKIKKPEDIAKFKGIPTLKKSVYKNFSKMLRDRFNFAGSWQNVALCHKWLSLSEMESVWTKKKIRSYYDLRIKYWDSCILHNYKLEDVSLFSIDLDEHEEGYLLWQKTSEPKIVIYYGASENIYKDFNSYLTDVLKSF